MNSYYPVLAVLIAYALLATACAKTEDATPTDNTSNDNLLLRSPSGTVASSSSPTNYLLSKPQYAVGYNLDQGKPIWVSWHLGAADLGSAPRQDDFRADTDLPSGWYQVKTSDYTGYGFNRGHNCPSADRTATVADNSANYPFQTMKKTKIGNGEKHTPYTQAQLTAILNIAQADS